MDPAVVKEVWELVKSDIWVMLLQASAVGIIILLFNNIMKTFAAYLSFRANNDIGKNVRLIMKGREAIITHHTIRFIHIRFKDNKNEMIIPMRRWETLDWEIIKNGQLAPAEEK